MSTNDTLVTDLDISIPLTSTMLPLVEQWVGLFLEHHAHSEVTPTVRNAFLNINSSDLVALTGYISAREADGLDGRRFKKRAKVTLEQSLLRSVNIGHRAHYKWCLAALNSLEPGRFI
jgi:hypothetical protein